MNKSTIIAVVVGIVVVACSLFWLGLGNTSTPQEETNPQPIPVATSTTTTTTTTTTTSVASEIGKHCGGNMRSAYVCAAGYVCTPIPGSHLPFGDVGGTCIAAQ